MKEIETETDRDCGELIDAIRIHLAELREHLSTLPAVLALHVLLTLGEGVDRQVVA